MEGELRGGKRRPLLILGGTVLPPAMTDEAFGEAGKRVVVGKGCFHNHPFVSLAPPYDLVGMVGKEGIRNPRKG